MLFSIIIGIIVLLVAYFHYTQGFFSAAISAILVVLAAVTAFSYHEVVVEKLLGGKMASSAHAMVLLPLLALCYLLPRSIIDSLVPGNIRLPLIVDKAGAAVMGLVAGVFAAGIVAIAGQELPFGPAVAGYARYAISDSRHVVVPRLTGPNKLDGAINDELKSDAVGHFDEKDRNGLMIPADDIVISAVSYLSDGALSGRQKLTDMHPDYLQELFGQRLGVEAGAQRVAMNLPEKAIESIKVVGVYQLQAVPALVDEELAEYRQKFLSAAAPQVKPAPNQLLVVVRAMFLKDAADHDDFLLRFSPASVRLVARSEGRMTNYYPVGTLDFASKLLVDKPDDYLFIDLAPGDRAADLVYLVDKEGFLTSDNKVAPGVFLELKRLGRVDLTGMAVSKTIAPSTDVAVMRKPEVVTVETKTSAGPAPAAPATPPAPGKGASLNSPQSIVSPIVQPPAPAP